MLVDNTGTGTAGVTGAIRQAAGTTGASFRYLLATAQIESGLNPNSKASTSSATGLFQFIDQTWLATMKDAGTSLGYGKYSAAITRTKSGRLFVKDPAMRSEIMGLRKDPTANALMAGAFTKQNAATLRGKIGREPTEGELYMAHFLGAGGATKLITAASQNPDAKATSIFPRAARSNNSIFYDKQGRARTTSQVYAVLTNKLDVARAKTDPATQTVTAVPPIAPPGVTVPATSTPIAASPLSVRGTRGVAAPLSMPLAATRGIIPNSPNAVRTISYFAPNAPRNAAPAPAVTPSAPVAPTDATRIPASVPDAAPPPTPAAPVGATGSVAPEPASYAPDDGPVFYDLFRSDGRQAVSSTVTELWGAPSRPLADAGPPIGDAAAVPPVANTSEPAAPAAPPANAPLDLFKTGHPQRPRFDRSS